MALQHKAMLVRMTVHAWTARKKDKKASKEVEQNHGAKDAGNYIKLLVDKKYLEPFQKIEGKLRDLFYSKTLAWGDSGERLLPSMIFFDFNSEIGTLINEADRLADEFVAQYPTMKQEARTKLGTLYDSMDYPADSDIRRRFGVELDYYPVPDAKDFRVEVSEDEANKIRDSITKGVEAKQKQATRECWDRLYDAVAKIEEVMAKDKPRIFDSLMGIPAELCTVLPKLNFGGDKELDAMCAEVRDRLVVNPDDLRDDAGFRSEIGRRAADIARKIHERRSAAA